MNITEFRADHPEYSDISDNDLAKKLHSKFYSDISYDEFSAKFIGAAKKQEEKPPAAPSLSRFDRFMTGMGDIVHGGAQLLSEVVPEPVEKGLNQFNNWLIDQGVPLARVPEGGVSQMVQEREQEYQRKRGTDDFDAWRLAGNIANPANLVAAARLPQAASLAGRMAAGAGYGAGYGALMPVTQGDFSGEKAGQVASGAVGGAVLPPLMGAAARVVKPYVSPALREIKNAGVTPTVAMSLGNTARRAEEAISSVPFLGDIIKTARRRTVTDLNNGVLNRALSFVGRKLPKDVDAGFPAVQKAHSILDSMYDDLLPKMKGVIDTELKQDLNNIKALARSLPPERKKQLLNTINDHIYKRFTSAGLASGETVKESKSVFGKLASDYARSSVADERRLGGAFREVQESLRRMIARNNPQYASELRELEKAWSVYKVAANASEKAIKNEGIYTAGQLIDAVKKGKTQRSIVYQDAPLLKLASAAHSLTGNKLPDSGTPLRSLMSLGLLGGSGVVHPMAPVAGAVAAAPYTRAGQKIADVLMNDRGLIGGRDIFGGASNLIRRSAMPLAPASVPLLQPFIDDR